MWELSTHNCLYQNMDYVFLILIRNRERDCKIMYFNIRSFRIKPTDNSNECNLLRKLSKFHQIWHDILPVITLLDLRITNKKTKCFSSSFNRLLISAILLLTSIILFHHHTI